MKTFKKRLLSVIILTMMLVFIFNACKKERVDEETFEPMDEFYDENKQKEQEFIRDTGSTYEPITGKEGSKIYDYKNIFMYPNGDSVYFPYTVKLIELYTPKDMILWKMPTVGGGKLLRTGGELRIRVFKNTDELVIRASNTMYIQTQKASKTPLSGMQVFYGFGSKENEKDWTNDATTLSGYLNPTDISTAGIDTSAMRYFMNISLLGWVNCDQFYGYTSSKTALTFTIDGKGTENIGIFLVFKDIRSVMKVNNLTSGDVPIGEKVTVIAMAKNDKGTYLLHNKEITIAANQKIALEFSETTKEGLLSALGAL